MKCDSVLMKCPSENFTWPQKLKLSQNFTTQTHKLFKYQTVRS